MNVSRMLLLVGAMVMCGACGDDSTGTQAGESGDASSVADTSGESSATEQASADSGSDERASSDPGSTNSGTDEPGTDEPGTEDSPRDEESAELPEDPRQRSMVLGHVGAVTDPDTGLTWETVATPFAWGDTNYGGYEIDEGVEVCETRGAYNVGGYDDWRLPTVEEYQAVLGNCEELVGAGVETFCDACYEVGSTGQVSAKCGTLFPKDDDVPCGALPNPGQTETGICGAMTSTYPTGGAGPYTVSFATGAIESQQFSYVRCVRP